MRICCPSQRSILKDIKHGDGGISNRNFEMVQNQDTNVSFLSNNGFKPLQYVKFYFVRVHRRFFFPIVVLEMCYNLVFLSSNVTWYNCFVPRMSDLIQRRQLSPWLWPDFLYIFFKQGREHKRSLNILHNFTDTV